MKKRGMKKKLKALQEMALEQLELEQKKQLELQKQLSETDNFLEQDGLRKSIEESTKHITMLRASLDDYNKLMEVKWKVTPDTVVMVIANLFGILLVLNFEKFDIVRTKAFGMIPRLKG